MVLISVSLMANDVEHLLVCLFAVCIFSSVKCLFVFLIELCLFVLMLSFESSFCVLYTSTLSDKYFIFCKYFPWT